MQHKNVKRQLVITLVAHQGYTRCIEKSIPSIWQNTLFPAITDTYIPLLKMMENLQKDEVPFSLSLVLSPTLCALLDDPVVQEEYSLWLERLIALGEQEIERTKNMPDLAALVKFYVKQLKQKKNFFTLCGGMLLPKFAEFASVGHIEFLVTAASFCFLPHYRKLNEAIDAQIEMGLVSHRNYFGAIPEGFWLPAMGYMEGLEKNIRKYGFSYTVLDSHGFLFSEPMPQNGVFSPACCRNSLAVFGRDPKTPEDINQNFVKNAVYRNQNGDIGFDFPLDDLQPLLQGQRERCVTGFKYWAQKSPKTIYNHCAADKQAALDAAKFLASKEERLEKASRELGGKSVSLVCAIDARDLGQNWYEGIYWLEQVFRQAAQSGGITCTSYSDVLRKQPDLQEISPFMSANEGSGYAENLLDKSNSWMLRYALKAAERMVDLADRFSGDSGLKERCLNLAAKQVLIAQSSDWPRMLHAGIKSDYACDIFKYSVQGFSTIYDSLGANSVSTEWLTRTEKDFPLFPWINYRIFGKKR
ncbi:DUF1957 domain-containing protein [Treponema sp. OMZ 840]|uniref:1,4-alpha-glucan branching protein domain-containing protein n=1 Tax=Treponema sp. OMZ 840 TaxID=244313 RepID=UPI003D92C363